MPRLDNTVLYFPLPPNLSETIDTQTHDTCLSAYLISDDIRTVHVTQHSQCSIIVHACGGVREEIEVAEDVSAHNVRLPPPSINQPSLCLINNAFGAARRSREYLQRAQGGTI